LSVSAAVEKSGVVGSPSAACSFAVKGFVRESVGVSAAAFFLSAVPFSSNFHWATGVVSWVKSVAVAVLIVVDSTSDSQKVAKSVIGKLTFDGAGVSSTEIICVSFKTSVSHFSSDPRPWKVTNFPRGTLDPLIFRINNRALVTFVQRFAESIDFVDWSSLTTSNIVVKVTPAAVFVELTKGASGDSGS